MSRPEQQLKTQKLSKMVFSILFYALLAYLGGAVLYQFTYSVAGKFRMRQRKNWNNKLNRFAVFIPAYKEDGVIVNVAKEALKQDYSTDLYDVIIIADSLKQETLDQLYALPIKVVEVNFEKSTKAKALNEAISRLQDPYDVALILDADNVMAKNFLNRMNAQFQQGFLAVQGRRVAKNMDTRMAVLDAASEEINNHILCKGHRVLGFSARLAGSGMAFEYDLFRRVMLTVNAVGGFDKELELKMTQMGVEIAYDDQAMVYDEKVRENKVFAKQRSRWIAAQFHYCRRFLGPGITALFTRGNFDFFNKALQMTLPPRLVLPGVLGLAAMTFLLTGNFTMAIIWGTLLILNVSAFLIAIPTYFFKKEYRGAFLGLPLAFASAVLALLKIGKANKKFIHTPHTTTSVEFKPNEAIK